MTPIARLRDGSDLHVEDLCPEAQTTQLAPHPDFTPFGMGNWLPDIQILTHLARGVADSTEGRPVALEIGTAEGRTALTIEKQGLDVHCVDIWNATGDGHYRQFPGQPQHVLGSFYLNCGDRICRTVFAHSGRSEDYARWWRIPLDLLYIDGDHSYGGVKQDARLWLPHVKPGGVVCGHDFHHYEVARAARECFNLEGWATYPNEGWGGLWWCRKEDYRG